MILTNFMNLLKKPRQQTKNPLARADNTATGKEKALISHAMTREASACWKIDE